MRFEIFAKFSVLMRIGEEYGGAIMRGRSQSALLLRLFFLVTKKNERVIRGPIRKQFYLPIRINGFIIS